MKHILITSTLLICLFSINPLHAKKGFFGTSEDIEKITDLDVRSPKGEELFLAYKTTMYMFIAGVYFKDEGYVLGIKGSYNSYYPLDDTMISDLQNNNQLPNPLPKYKIPLKDYAIGFSAWPILLVLIYRIYLWTNVNPKK